ITNFAPSLANVRAVALPIPDAPPVTNATFPSTRPAMSRPPVHTASIGIVLMQILHYVAVCGKHFPKAHRRRGDPWRRILCRTSAHIRERSLARKPSRVRRANHIVTGEADGHAVG